MEQATTEATEAKPARVDVVDRIMPGTAYSIAKFWDANHLCRRLRWTPVEWVVSPEVMTALVCVRGVSGHYLLTETAYQPRLWGIPVVESVGTRVASLMCRQAPPQDRSYKASTGKIDVEAA